MHMDSWNLGELTEIHGRGDKAINSPSIIIFAPHWGSWLCFPDIVTRVFFHVFSHWGQLRAVNTEYKLKVLELSTDVLPTFFFLFLYSGRRILCLCRQTHTYLPRCNCTYKASVSSLWHDVHLHREDKKQMLLLSKLFEAFTTFS